MTTSASRPRTVPPAYLVRKNGDRRAGARASALRHLGHRRSVVVVLRRGPSDWSHVGLWRLDPLGYESGAWLHGHLYPQRCDVSPDGLLLAYLALTSGKVLVRRQHLRGRLPTAVAAPLPRGAPQGPGPGVCFADPEQWSLATPTKATPRRCAAYGLTVAGADSSPSNDVGAGPRPPQHRPAPRTICGTRSGWHRDGEGQARRRTRPPRTRPVRRLPVRSGGRPGPVQVSAVTENTSTALEDVQWADWTRAMAGCSR